MNSLFFLANNCHKPIYQQLLEQGRNGILSASFAPGIRLPSIRELALELGINHHTVAKAYQQLEEEGLIVMRQGKGAYVVEKVPLEKRQAYILSQVQELVKEAQGLGFKQEELLEIIREEYCRKGGGDGC